MATKRELAIAAMAHFAAKAPQPARVAAASKQPAGGDSPAVLATERRMDRRRRRRRRRSDGGSSSSSSSSSSSINSSSDDGDAGSGVGAGRTPTAQHEAMPAVQNRDSAATGGSDAHSSPEVASVGTPETAAPSPIKPEAFDDSLPTKLTWSNSFRPADAAHARRSPAREMRFTLPPQPAGDSGGRGGGSLGRTRSTASCQLEQLLERPSLITSIGSSPLTARLASPLLQRNESIHFQAMRALSSPDGVHQFPRDRREEPSASQVIGELVAPGYWPPVPQPGLRSTSSKSVTAQLPAEPEPPPKVARETLQLASGEALADVEEELEASAALGRAGRRGQGNDSRPPARVGARWAEETPGAAASAMPEAALADPAAPSPSSSAAGRLRAELSALKPSALQRRAKKVGVAEAKLEEALDSDDPKTTVILLILEGLGFAAEGMAEGELVSTSSLDQPGESDAELESVSDMTRPKTFVSRAEICSQFAAGTCSFGGRCCFAHGEAELKAWGGRRLGAAARPSPTATLLAGRLGECTHPVHPPAPVPPLCRD